MNAEERKKRRRKNRRRLNKRRRIRRLLTIYVCVWIIGIALMIYVVFPYFNIKKAITIEAGSNKPLANEFLKWKSKNAKIVSGLPEDTNLNTVTDYEVEIKLHGRKVSSTLHVADTIAPTVETQNRTIFSGSTVQPEDFIQNITDASDTTVAFKEMPDCESAGIHEVVLQVKDAGGNVTEATASLEVLVDTEPPVIEGVKELTTTVGGSISYKKDVTVTDDFDDNVELIIDSSNVDLNNVGDYEVTYMATDSAGNEASVTTTVHVKTASIQTATENTINIAADKILATIITDDMSDYEKAEKIYWWCHEKIAYVDATPKEDYIRGAYQGLINRRGDCYTYAMSAKCLLTRAGITNMDIERIPAGNEMHYWNLIDVGEGWYHYDTCRRADGSTFFYKTDAEIKRYSDSHDNCHNYDRSKYPKIN